MYFYYNSVFHSAEIMVRKPHQQDTQKRRRMQSPATAHRPTWSSEDTESIAPHVSALEVYGQITFITFPISLIIQTNKKSIPWIQSSMKY